MISNKKQLEIGYSGLALLRNRLVGDPKMTHTIFSQIRKLATSSDVSYLKEDIQKLSVSSGYRKWSATYDIIPNLLIEVEEPVITTILKKFHPGIAVDVACGTGRLSRILQHQGHQVTGIDTSPDMLNVAKANVPQAKFIVGNSENLYLADNSVDLAVSALALTHLPSLNQTISELARVVHPEGHVVLSDIHPWFVIIGGQAEFQDINGKKGFVVNYMHLLSEYIRAFAKYGLVINNCREVTLDQKYINPSDLNLGISKPIMDLALKNLPLVLIWELEKKK